MQTLCLDDIPQAHFSILRTSDGVPARWTQRDTHAKFTLRVCNGRFFHAEIGVINGQTARVSASNEQIGLWMATQRPRFNFCDEVEQKTKSIERDLEKQTYLDQPVKFWSSFHSPSPKVLYLHLMHLMRRYCHYDLYQETISQAGGPQMSCLACLTRRAFWFQGLDKRKIWNDMDDVPRFDGLIDTPSVYFAIFGIPCYRPNTVIVRYMETFFYSATYTSTEQTKDEIEEPFAIRLCNFYPIISVHDL